MDEFEALLRENLIFLQRYVKFKINNKHDAEDIIQNVCLAATAKFGTLKDPLAFKAWLIGIAAHKCNDYYRNKAKVMQIPLDQLFETVLTNGRRGITEHNVVRDTLDELGDKEKQILYLYFFKDMPQDDIAKQLSLPIGTVKSRLHYAKEKFKQHYPYSTLPKGETAMKKIPEFLPEYKIESSELPPFSVKWEELQGWLLIPRLGKNIIWGLYNMPSRKRTEYTQMEVIGKAEVHGIEGVEISAIQYDTENYYRTDSIPKTERRFVAQLTDTHCRYLAESHVENGIRKLYTFLDGDSFLNNWGFGEDNCGNEVNLSSKGIIKRNGNAIESCEKDEVLDIVGRYNVTIGGKTYDTVCVIDIQCFNDNVASEQYLDKNGRTILWRRFNKNDWAIRRYRKLWTELLPQNERLTINGETYVHWYDCVTDYIF
ncbi:MAG: sigma-70 family RNA polymerase sigma factor [Oscillospiraceae bacterium]|nr:sigma-70 family RNA polymerase sigma factor [Oscillospiraceae bacterium]MBQ9938218.1 sigma-70 family RNA polymerase sigma factor [Oscillospiraceae bacterium]